MGHLISPEALAAHSAAVVFDCRFSLFDSGAGRREYEAGHVPGARFADLERDLSSPPGPGGAGGRHPLPDRDELAARMRAWGVHDDSLVVCYDQNSGAFAGRLFGAILRKHRQKAARRCPVHGHAKPAANQRNPGQLSYPSQRSAANLSIRFV